MRATQLPPLFSRIEIEFTTEGEAPLCATGMVVNHGKDGGGCYVHFDSDEERKAVEAWLSRARPPGIEPEKLTSDEPSMEEAIAPDDDEQNRNTNRPTPAWELIDPSSSEPIHAQVRRLSLAEKLKVARTATRPVRELLIRDSEKRIHAEVLRNPKVTDEEIMQYTGMPNLSPRVLDWVAAQPKYMRRRAVLLNIVQNPMTPPDTAKKLLSRLNDHELLRLQRSSKVREAVSRAAKKILMRKGVL